MGGESLGIRDVIYYVISLVSFTNDLAYVI